MKFVLAWPLKIRPSTEFSKSPIALHESGIEYRVIGVTLLFSFKSSALLSFSSHMVDDTDKITNV